MAYTCIVYNGTGFNGVNLPDTPANIDKWYTPLSLPTMDILQERFLDHVDVAATWDQVKNASYVKVGNFYYSVRSVYMTSPDVARINLKADFITSAGGMASLTILDGITSRHHVKKEDDTFGAYTQEDPYLSPSRPLKLEAAGWKGEDDGNDETFMVSTLDLSEMGQDGYEKKGATFIDPTSGEKVTTPELTFSSQSTNYTIEDGKRSAFLQGITTFRVSIDELTGANVARNLGSETAITAQYAIPAKYVSDTPEGESGKRTSMKGVKGTIDSALPFEYTTVKNKRVLYGSLNKYGIITASGNKADFNPEDIRGADSTAKFQYVTDVRPQGRPYFAPANYHGNTDIWGNNPIGGEGWRDVPLIYYQKSGNVQDAYNFSADRRIEASQYINSNVQRWTGLAARTGERLSGALDLDPLESASKLVGGYISGAADILSTTADQAFSSEQYELDRNKELYNFEVGQHIIAPQVEFPYSDGTIRDYVGNNLYIYRYRPDDLDIKKFDKILTMFGYADTAPLTSDMFSNRKNFNYVQAQGVSIGGDLPTWWKEGIAMQLGVGVRIWHVKPDTKYYTEEN